ncbi:hypothetical protein [Sinomonas halotolerans]|uniref:Uncharacterized protein n=1 Tax=Sinomonas halotolerans TaxID=1644133 RepID=A0ABU9X2E6_9MICC
MPPFRVPGYWKAGSPISTATGRRPVGVPTSAASMSLEVPAAARATTAGSRASGRASGGGEGDGEAQARDEAHVSRPAARARERRRRGVA